MERKEIKVRIHPSKHKRLKILAAKQGKSLNFIMEISIADFLARYENLNYDDIFKKEKED
jgi:predicted HicB family RNase H-like nuclease